MAAAAAGFFAFFFAASAIDGAVTIITEASRNAILRMQSPSKRPPVDITGIAMIV